MWPVLVTLPPGFMVSPKAVTEGRISNVVQLVSTIDDPMEYGIDKNKLFPPST